VRVRVAVSPPYRAILVSQAAIGTDQNRQFVFVLDDENKVARRDVKAGTVHDGLQAVEGVTADDRVIVVGLQRVKPGAVVNPRLVEMPVPPQGSAPQNPPAVSKAPPPATKPKS
jgi:hypothetical protein